MRSFYNERTAEYALVPAFRDILCSLGDPTPVYFWKTREGNKTSECIHGSEDVRVIAFFARRPKIDISNKTVIQGKINYQIYDYSKLASEENIPVFCGLPLTTNVFELNSKKFLWFYVDPKLTDAEPIFNIESGSVKPENFDASNLVPLLSSDITDIVKKISHNVPWSNAVEKMEKLHRKPKDQYYFAPWWVRNWHYKPIYFLLRKL